MKVRQMFDRSAGDGRSTLAGDGHAIATSGRRAMALVIAIPLVLSLLSPAPAHAITRDEVISRASSWVRMRVGYSQRAYYGGYRRDCSGLVSMSWKLRTSLTSRTISSVGRRISFSSLKPGDAIVTPGHVEIFAGWKNRRARAYVTLEQSSNSGRAVRRVKTIRGRAMALRYRHISDAVPPVLVASSPAGEMSTPTATPPSADVAGAPAVTNPVAVAGQ